MGINKHSLEKSGKIAVEGGEIGYRYYMPHNEEARQRTPLVVVHGGPGGCSIGMYDSMHALADERPVLFYDQLGSYLSPATMTPDLMTVERFEEEPAFLLKELGIDKAVFLGHSWGGVVVTQFALNHPDKMAGLVLSSPLISTQRWVDDCNLLLKALPQDVQDTIERCQRDGTTDSKEYEAADEIFGKKHFCRLDPVPDAVTRNHKRTNRTVYNAMWGPSEFSHAGTLGNLDLFPRLKEITAPTLVITGEYDTATPAYMQEVQGEIKGAELFIVPDAGHATLADNNDAYLRAVGGFLGGVEVHKPAPAAPVRKTPQP